MNEMRLAKAIAKSGLASRREAETWIRAGRVHVDNVVQEDVATLVDPSTTQIRVDGRMIPRPPPLVYSSSCSCTVVFLLASLQLLVQSRIC